MSNLAIANDNEARASTADVAQTIVNMLEQVKQFATNALRDELKGGRYQDEAGGMIDKIGDAIGEARKVESDLTGI